MKTKIIKLINILLLMLFWQIPYLQTSAQCGLRNYTGLTSITFDEYTTSNLSKPPCNSSTNQCQNKFDLNNNTEATKMKTRLSDLLSTDISMSGDFNGEWYRNDNTGNLTNPKEKYDVFFSDANGNLDSNGCYITIEAVYPDATNIYGALNIGWVRLEFGINNFFYAKAVTHVVGNGGNYYSSNNGFILGTETTPLGNTIMGNTQGMPASFRLSITVEFNLPNSIPPIIASSLPNQICSGDCAQLSVSGVLSPCAHWQWYSGSCGGTPVPGGTNVNNILVCPTTTTTYFVREEGGCSLGSCALKTVTVCPPMVIQANVNYQSACKGCVLIILSGGCTPYTYSWTGPNGYTSSTKNPCSLDPGTYNLTVTDAGGCHATKTVIVNPPAPVLNLTVNNHDYPTCCPILNVSGVNANSCSYNWTGPCITNSTIQNPCPVTCDGLYCVTVTTNIGCTASACVERKCHDCSDTLCKYWAVGGNSSTNGGHIDGTYNLDNILGINDVGLNGNTPPNPGNTNLSPLRIFTNSTEQVRILSTGQVGIGTTTPTATLDVLGFQVNADERNFRVRSRDGGNLGNNGNLVNTELSGLTHSPANVPPLPGVSWTALFARQGNASKAGTFVGDVTIMGDPNVGGANGASIGTLGVGTITPTEKLHVHNGSIFITGAARQGGPMILFGDDGIIKTGHPDGNWGIEYEPTYGGLNFWKPFGSAGGFANNLLFLKDNGNVGIGTPKPTEKLFVCGNITATGNITAGGLMTATVLKISNTPIDCPTFPDYVFNKNYKLMTLKEVEEYIVSNHHLPNVPSASDIKTNGIDVAKMSFNQLEKVEELYLHVIELNKSIEQLKAANKELQAQMKKLVKK